jgi:hypothetical protein
MDQVTPNLDQTSLPFVKQEVKIEPEESVSTQPLSIQPPSSTFYLKHSLLQSTLYNALLGQMTAPFRFPVKNLFPQPRRWPLIAPGPTNSRPMPFYRPEYDNRTFMSNFIPNQALIKKPKDLPVLTPSTTDSSGSLVKKEEAMEEIEEKIVNEEQTIKKPESSSKKKPQNRIKNIPGLVVQRVRSSIKTYYAQNPGLNRQESRLNYVGKVLSGLNKSDKERLIAFLDQYEKNWKTWNTIQKYLATNTKYGGILLDVVLEFFTDDGKEDFNDWLYSGKMKEKSRCAVQDMKFRIADKFEKLLREIGDEGYLELKAKMVKKEEAY